MKPRTQSALLVTWIIAFTLTTLYGFEVNRDLIKENRHRIADIKQAQIEACLRAYSLVNQTIVIIAPIISKNNPYGNPSEIGQRIAYLLQQADPKKCYS